MRIDELIELSPAPDTPPEERRGALLIHLAELRRYRRRTAYVAGLGLFVCGVLYTLADSARGGDLVTPAVTTLCFGLSMACVLGTVTEHYSRLLYRLGHKPADDDSASE